MSSKRSAYFFWWSIFFGLASVGLAIFARLSWKSAQELSTQLKQALATNQAISNQLEKANADSQQAHQQWLDAYLHGLNLQVQLVEGTHPQRSLLLTLEAGRLAGPTPSLETIQALLRQLNRIVGRTLGTSQYAPDKIIFSPDGHWLVASHSDSISVWDMKTADQAEPLVLGDFTDRILNLAFSPNGDWFAAGSAGQTVHLWDLRADQPFSDPILLSGHEEGVSAIEFSPDGNWLATSSFENVTSLWNLSTIHEDVTPIPLPNGEPILPMWVTDLAFSPDSRWLVGANFDSYIYVWNIQAAVFPAEPLKLFGEQLIEVRSVDFSPDGHWLVSAAGDGKLRLWDMQSGDVQSSMRVINENVGVNPRVRFSPDGTWVVSTSLNTLSQIGPNGEVSRQVTLQGASGVAVFSPDTHWLATAGSDHTIRLWDLTEGSLKTYRNFKGHDEAITSLAFSPDGSWLVSGSDDKTIRLWDIKNAGSTTNPVFLSLDSPATMPPVLSQDGKRLAYPTEEAAIQLLDLASGQADHQPIPLQGTSGEISLITFSPQGHWLAAANKDGTAWLWDLKNLAQAPPIELSGHVVEITTMAFSSDENWLATGSLDLTARLWNLEASDPAADFITLRGHDGGITALALSPDNHWLATGSLDTTVRLWDLSSKDPSSSTMVLEDFETEVSVLAFSPSGHWLVTGANESQLPMHLWNLTSPGPARQPVTLSSGTLMGTCCVAFSPDEHWLVGGSGAQLWDLTTINSDTQSLGSNTNLGQASVLTFSQDGKWLALGSYSGIQLVNTQDPYATDSLRLGTESVSISALEFRPDDRSLIATGQSAVSIWYFSWHDLYAAACQVAGRNLTQLEWKQYFPEESYHASCPQWPDGE